MFLACFLALTQHYKEMKNHPDRVSNMKSFLDLYNWKGM